MKNSKLLSLLFLAFPFNLFAQKGKNLELVIISACNEYVSHITLKEYKNNLEKNYSNIHVTLLQGAGPINDKNEFSTLEGTEALKNCDVLLIFARRTAISGKALDDIRQYVNSGKPFVALRTSSHGFQGWPDFDKTVLGGNYSGHYDGDPEERKMGADGILYPVGEPRGSILQVTINPANKAHPILKGISNFTSKYSLYKTSPIAGDAKLLLTGTIPGGQEPVAWIRIHNGARLVYIGLGGLQDWRNPNFTNLVTNSLFWTADFKGKRIRRVTKK